MYVVIEGLDCTFKSSISSKLENLLKTDGYECELARQPGSTPCSEAIRELLKFRFEDEVLTDFSEIMLCLAARSQLFKYKIQPHLNKGGTFISDRCNLSTIAYQSSKGTNPDKILNQIKSAPWFIKADLLVVIDIPSTLATERLLNRGEHIDDYETRLAHCEHIYRTFPTHELALNTMYIKGIQNGHELTSDELAHEVYKRIKELS